MKSRVLVSIALAALLLASCELALGPRAEGTLVLNLGGGPASRVFSDAPFSGLPVFSSVTVTVSGSGMPTASKTVPGTATSVTLQVPAGPARKVEVYAVPDWEATQLQQGSTPLPTLAKVYGGTAIVDVAGGQKVPVSMEMDVVETKIVLPDPYNNNSIKVTDSIETLGSLTNYMVGMGSSGRAGFDRYGRLLYSDGDLIRSRTNPDEVAEIAGYGDGPFTFDSKRNRLYYFEFGSLRYHDFDTLEIVEIFVQGSWSPDGHGMAVDRDGYLYTVCMQSEDRYLVKLVITDPVWNGEFWSSDAEVRESVRYASAGLWTNAIVGDLAVVGDLLYVIAYEVNADGYDPGGSISRGMILALKASDLSRVEDFGWSSSLIPQGDSTTKLFGPRRVVAILPRKLVVADDGFWWDGSSSFFEDRNGVAVLDIESGTLERRELTGVDFIDDFSSIFIY